MTTNVKSDSRIYTNINKLIKTNITLRKKDHTYILKNSPQISFNNVTNIVDSQFPPFEREKIAGWLANKSYKYDGYTKDEILQEWKEIRDAGSKVHSQIDKYIKSGKIPTLPKAKNAIDWYDETINKYGSKKYSEVIVFSKELEVAGSVDLLVYDPDKNECSLFDWKTSKMIKRTRGKAAITDACYGLTDCHFDQYSLQLSIYSYLLRKYHAIPVTKHFMVHLTDQGVDCIEADNHSEIVENIIEDDF